MDMPENEPLSPPTDGNILIPPENENQPDNPGDVSEGVPSPAEAGAENQSPADWDNFRYKVIDEEKPFADWAKPFVKNEETYKNFQELYTRADGLDHVKQEREEFRTKYNELENSVVTLNDYLKKGDVGGFISALGLQEKQFLDYAIDRIKYSQLPPEEKAQIDAQRHQQTQMLSLEQQNEQLQRNFAEQQTRQKEYELNVGLTSQGVAPLAQQYDSQLGQGAFRQRVIEQGIYHAQLGTQLTADQAITETIRILGLQSAGAPPVQPNGNAGTHAPQVPQNRKPVIPNIKGQGTSPLKKQFKSIEDIERHREERLSAQ